MRKVLLMAGAGDEEQVREGGCGCGATRYRLSGEPIFVNNCHCLQCQQQTGGTSVVNIFIEGDRFALLSGNLARHTVTAGSGGPHVIVRCADCGVALYSEYPRLGALGIGVRAGTLDDPASVTPDAAVFASEKMPWVTLPEGIPHFDTYYVHAEVLAPDRLARMEALVALRAQERGA